MVGQRPRVLPSRSRSYGVRSRYRCTAAGRGSASNGLRTATVTKVPDPVSTGEIIRRVHRGRVVQPERRTRRVRPDAALGPTGC